MKKTNESGRSMVEMLGVLAIIGVLSVGGIAGYTTAMNKHQANQILNGASVRAIVVSTQIQRGSTAPTLGEFTEADNEVGGAKFGTEVKNETGTADWTTTDKCFSLTLTGVDEKVCTQMKATVGKNSVIKAIADDCTTITYHNDLPTTAIASDYKTEESCMNAGKEWCGTACSDSCGPTCPEGTSENGAGGFAKNVDTLQCYCNGENEKWSGSACDGTLPEGTCLDNTDCKEGEYCDYQRNVDCETGPRETGTCKTAAVASGSNDYGFTLSASSNMDWFSAKNFCEALNGTMVSLDDFHIKNKASCSGTSCFEEGYSWDNVKTGNLSSTWWWTKDLRPSNSCYAFYINSNSKFQDVYYANRNSTNYALCWL